MILRTEPRFLPLCSLQKNTPLAVMKKKRSIVKYERTPCKDTALYFPHLKS